MRDGCVIFRHKARDQCNFVIRDFQHKNMHHCIISEGRFDVENASSCESCCKTLENVANTTFEDRSHPP